MIKEITKYVATEFIMSRHYSPVMPKLNFENSNDILSKPKETNSFQPNVKNIFNTMPKRGCEWPKGHPDEIDFHFNGSYGQYLFALQYVANLSLAVNLIVIHLHDVGSMKN